jgi:hypothetical protein
MVNPTNLVSLSKGGMDGERPLKIHYDFSMLVSK